MDLQSQSLSQNPVLPALGVLASVRCLHLVPEKVFVLQFLRSYTQECLRLDYFFWRPKHLDLVDGLPPGRYLFLAVSSEALEDYIGQTLLCQIQPAPL